MNPLPRVLGLALLLVLIALSALLFGTLSSPGRVPPGANAPPSSSAPARVAAFAQRVALPLALTAVVLTVGLLASLAVRRPRSGDSHAPFNVTRTEVGALAKLAESSAAQSQELAHERDGRQRAEADALLNQQLLNRSLQEKIRLGRDLHDGIIQSLYAAGLTLESARPLVNSDPAEADRRIERTRDSLNRCIRDVRAYIAGLAPEDFRSASFAQTLQALAEELAAGRDVQLDLQIDDAAARALSPAQSVEALQIVRESISNSLRHGDASRVSVRLAAEDRTLCIDVRDNGRGFNPDTLTRTGHGLGNMRARAAGLGADLRIESEPEAGTRIVLTLPLPG